MNVTHKIRLDTFNKPYDIWTVDVGEEHTYASVPAEVWKEGQGFICNGTMCAQLRIKHGKKFTCKHITTLKKHLSK